MKSVSLAFFGLICLCFADAAFSGTVTKVNAAKKQVTIDMGKEAGIAKDAEICFTDDAGKKITCGTVKSVKAKTAIVKIKSKKAMAKIAEGTAAAAGTGGETATADGAAPAVGAKSPKLMAIRLLYLPAIISQAAYNNMTYLAPEEGKTPTTLWEPGEKSSLALISMGLEFDVVRYGVALGVRPFRSYRTDKGFSVDSDYTRSNKNPYCRTLASASALGFYLDYNFMNPKAVASGLKIGAGLDFDMSTVTYSLDQREDGSEVTVPLYRITSKLTVISLRVPVGYELNLGSMGLNFGTNLMIPVVGNTPTASNSITDPNTAKYGGDEAAQTKAATDDIAKSLGHKKSSFAVELAIGAFYAF